MAQRYAYQPDDGRVSYVCLTEPSSGLVLCLVGHPTNAGEPFSEARTGLDHLEFLVPHRDDLDEWATRLDQLGIARLGSQDTSVHEERDADLSRSGQHPARVLLARTIQSNRLKLAHATSTISWDVST